VSEIKPLCCICGAPLPSRWKRVCAKCVREQEEEADRKLAEELDQCSPVEDSDEIPDGMIHDQYHGWIYE